MQEQDANRACMSDIFMNTDGFSTKTVNAIAREVIYKVTKIMYPFLRISYFLAKQIVTLSSSHQSLSYIQYFRKGWKQNNILCIYFLR